MTPKSLFFRKVDYLINPEKLHLSWLGFSDPESDISDFTLQLYQGDSCNQGEIGDDHHFEAMNQPRDVKNDTEMIFYDYTFEEGKGQDFN